MLIRTIIISIIVKVGVTNLIKHGDFQTYSNTPLVNYTDISYISIPPNMSVWYTPDLGYIELQQIHTPDRTTIGVDLSSSHPMTLCQDVDLEIGNKYMLSYSLYSIYYSQMIGMAFINNILAATLWIPTSYTFNSTTYQFYADRRSNSICFNQTHLSQTNAQSMGGVIDNISLILIQSYIVFEYLVDQIQSKIVLSTNLSYSLYHAYLFNCSCGIYLGQELMRYELVNATDGNLQVQIRYNSTFNLNTLHFVTNSSVSMANFYISSRKPLQNIYYYKLQKGYLYILDKSKATLVTVSKITKRIQSLSRIFIFSYFISCIVDGQYLSLFYIFVKIRTVPEFAKDFYHKILQIIFSSQNSPQFIRQLLGIPQVIDLQMQNDITQKIDVQKDEQSWFGTYGLSSRLMRSNFTNVFALILLIIKYRLLKLILKWIRKLVHPSIKDKFRLSIKSSTLLLTQFCFMTPTIIVQVMSNIMSSVSDYRQEGYRIFCIVFLSFIIGCLSLYIFHPDTQKKSSKKTKIMQKNTEYTYQSLLIPLIFFIPFTVYINKVLLFLLLNGFVVILRLLAYYKLKFEKTSKFIRKTAFVNIILWIIHHSIFTILWVCEKQNLDQNQLQLIKNLGFASIINVLMIFLIEIIKLLMTFFEFAQWIIKFVDNLCKEYKKSEESQQKEMRQKQIKQNKNVVVIVIKNKQYNKSKEIKKQKQNYLKAQIAKNHNRIKQNNRYRSKSSKKRQMRE